VRAVALSWIFLLTLNHDARNHESKKKENQSAVFPGLQGGPLVHVIAATVFHEQLLLSKMLECQSFFFQVIRLQMQSFNCKNR
jgi:glycine/serine hydroxymethyltransferase